MYYIIFGFFYLLSLLPFWLLYIFSDCIYLLLYYVIRYRRDVVASNLEIAFPEKSAAERKKIEKDFYKQFTDNFIETIKLFSISEKEMRKRYTGNFEVLDELQATGRSAQLHSGHFFNWEYANSGFSLQLKYTLITVYMPIENKYFERAFKYMRSRFGAELIPATDFAARFATYSKTQYCIALVGDQNPGNTEKAYWTKFFGRMTPIVRGPEITAKMTGNAVAMCNFYRVKRGYYRTDIVLLTTDPKSLPHGEITRKMMEYVEQSIRRNPACYLWSHRRWKYSFDPEKHGRMVV